MNDAQDPSWRAQQRRRDLVLRSLEVDCSDAAEILGAQAPKVRICEESSRGDYKVRHLGA